jgi:RsiW-degrading membrane proteinase PrsW (M82 family)
LTPLAYFSTFWPLLPGILWLWFFYRTDRHPEPARIVTATFLLGVVAILPAFAVEHMVSTVYPFLRDMQSLEAPATIPALIGCFLVIGPTEELTKFAVVRLYSYRQRDFDEPMDGLVYAAAAALGFASVENVLYVFDFSTGKLRWDALGLRSVLSLPAHVLFSAQWGYALGRRRFDPSYPVVSRVVLAAALHGLYDFILVYPALQPFVLLYMFLLVPVVVWQFRVLRQSSAG